MWCSAPCPAGQILRGGEKKGPQGGGVALRAPPTLMSCRAHAVGETEARFPCPPQLHPHILGGPKGVEQPKWGHAAGEGASPPSPCPAPLRDAPCAPPSLAARPPAGTRRGEALPRAGIRPEPGPGTASQEGLQPARGAPGSQRPLLGEMPGGICWINTSLGAGPHTHASEPSLVVVPALPEGLKAIPCPPQPGSGALWVSAGSPKSSAGSGVGRSHPNGHPGAVPGAGRERRAAPSVPVTSRAHRAEQSPRPLPLPKPPLGARSRNGARGTRSHLPSPSPTLHRDPSTAPSQHPKTTARRPQAPRGSPFLSPGEHPRGTRRATWHSTGSVHLGGDTPPPPRHRGGGGDTRGERHGTGSGWRRGVAPKPTD